MYCIEVIYTGSNPVEKNAESHLKLRLSKEACTEQVLLQVVNSLFVQVGTAAQYENIKLKLTTKSQIEIR